MTSRKPNKFAVPVDASIKLIEIDIADIITDFVTGNGKLPLERVFDAPPVGGLTEGILDNLEKRAESIDRDSIWWRHRLTIFASGEWEIDLLDSCAGRDAFVLLTLKPVDYESLSPTQWPAARLIENLFYEKAAQLITAAARDNGAKKVHLIQPYMFGARNDQEHGKRKATVALQAQTFEPFIDTTTSLHLHAPQIPGFWRQPFFHLAAKEIFIPHFLLSQPQSNELIKPDKFNLQHVQGLFDSAVFCSPDVGGAKNVRDFAEYARSLAARILLAVDGSPVTTDALSRMEENIPSIPIAIADKRRGGPNMSEIVNVVGSVSGRRASIWDDIGDTLGTFRGASQAFRNHGAVAIDGYLTHFLGSGDAMKNLVAASVDSAHTTDSIRPRRAVRESSLITIHGVAPMLTQVVIDLITNADPNVRAVAARHMPSHPLIRDKSRYLPPVLETLGYPASLFTNPHP